MKVKHLLITEDFLARSTDTEVATSIRKFINNCDGVVLDIPVGPGRLEAEKEYLGKIIKNALAQPDTFIQIGKAGNFHRDDILSVIASVDPDNKMFIVTVNFKHPALPPQQIEFPFGFMSELKKD